MSAKLTLDGDGNPILFEDDDCIECGEVAGGTPPTAPCPKSQRPCGHHCNHVWTGDSCDWCGAHFDEDDPETLLIPGVDYEEAVCDNCGKKEHTPAELKACVDSMIAPAAWWDDPYGYNSEDFDTPEEVN